VEERIPKGLSIFFPLKNVILKITMLLLFFLFLWCMMLFVIFDQPSQPHHPKIIDFQTFLFHLIILSLIVSM